MDEKQLRSESKVFCMAPWTHLHVQTDGEVRLCCLAFADDPIANLQDANR